MKILLWTSITATATESDVTSPHSSSVAHCIPLDGFNCELLILSCPQKNLRCFYTRAKYCNYLNLPMFVMFIVFFVVSESLNADAK